MFLIFKLLQLWREKNNFGNVLLTRTKVFITYTECLDCDNKKIKSQKSYENNTQFTLNLVREPTYQSKIQFHVVLKDLVAVMYIKLETYVMIMHYKTNHTKFGIWAWLLTMHIKYQWCCS